MEEITQLWAIPQKIYQQSRHLVGKKGALSFALLCIPGTKNMKPDLRVELGKGGEEHEQVWALFCFLL